MDNEVRELTLLQWKMNRFIRLSRKILYNKKTMNKLNILWTTDNRDNIFNLLTMYAINSKRHNW